MTRITAPWLRSPEIRRVFDLFQAGGHQIFAVGGCVRNTLLDRDVADIDMATDAPPETVLALAQAAEIRAVPTGIAHGTVTLVVQGVPFEVTTFRDDVETDGRRAVVRFSRDVRIDAARRDFTMNALYVDRDGVVLDAVGGLRDVAARQVRFIGNPEQRLREDYLRALRYFRFLACYGDPSAGVDPEALAAIAAELDGMHRLSRERITDETLKLLAADDPAPALAAMQAVGLMRVLYEGGDAVAVARLAHAERAYGLDPDPILRLAALGLPSTDRSLRLSKAQSRHLLALQDGLSDMAPAPVLGYRLGHDRGVQCLALRAAVLETPADPSLMAEVARGAEAHFPLAAADLMPELEGVALGAALRRLEETWIGSDFSLDKAALLKLR